MITAFKQWLFPSLAQSSKSWYRGIGIIERYSEPLYDWITVTGSEKTARFFQNPLSSIDPVTGKTKTLTSTNMLQADSLPYPYNFEIEGVNIIIDYGTPHFIIHKFITGTFKMTFGAASKDYFVYPIEMLTCDKALDRACPCKSCADKYLSTDYTRVYSGRRNYRGRFVLAEPICLISQQTFCAEITLPENLNLNQPVRVGLYLDGHFKKEVV